MTAVPGVSRSMRQLGCRVDLPAGVLGDVGAEHVGDTVSLDAAQVCHGEHFGRLNCVRLRVAHLLKHPPYDLLQGLDGNAHFVFLGYFESFEHF